MDPEVLQTVLDLSEPPKTQSGSIYGFKVKMWGIYPAVVPQKEGKVPGTVWRISTADQLRKLSEYETAAYTRCSCEVYLDSGEVLGDSQTFCWGGDPKSKELEDGQFDLVRYQRYFKDSVVRKRDTE
ncbi:hypothetical protein ASPWEDRAFT_174715 [Aspergillus wentii DTO 134E9]|uniref:Putative gamma-glutamylcyclotransferase n=1 Tax=Aspergillus wentii DTO 134E9 TaxID=1073089 RepID=A0A1L9REG6_ASPWE|nr:uncharacterized protein ASPWEDRAFT_174715 [Aspergillus wentii DTO 134E9]OJJ33304.1 hypothetical protein ASPWEDRAFT_174715 [Aspergillus wentii DTO 134E9]